MAWFAYGGAKIGQGRENAKQYLAEHPEICSQVEAKVRAKYQLPGSEETQTPEEAGEMQGAGMKHRSGWFL